MSALPPHSPSLQCSHSIAFLQPLLHQGGCARGGHLGLNCQGCCGTCSTPFSGLLQPSVRSVEDLGVVASSHRPLPSQSFCGRVPLSDGDHSVCAPVRAPGRLDGLHRSQGSVSSSAGSSCLSSLSTLRLPWLGLPVQGSMLWPLHGSAGLLQGHGSCFSYSPFSRYSYASIPRRLASPVFLSGSSPEGSSDCPRSVSRVGDCHQSLKVQPRTFPGCTVSRGRYQLHLFQGFSVSGTRHSAAVNSRRISILRLAYRELVAISSRCAFFAGSPSSWRPAKNAVPPALSPSFLGPSGYGRSALAVEGVSSRSPVVAPSPSSVSRRLSAPSVSRPALLVRRLGRGLGRPSRLSGRFGRQAALSINARELLAVPVPVSSPGSHRGCLLRQHHGSRLPSQGGWHQISSPQHLGSGDLTLDGVPLHPPGSTVSSGVQQCSSRRPISPSPAPKYRVVSTHDRVSVFEKTVAGSNRLICNLRQSSLLDLLLPFPGSEVSRHGRLSPVLGRTSGLCVSSGGCHSACDREAPGLHGDGAHSGGSPLGSTPLVFGPGPAVAGSSRGSPVPSRPPALASVSSSLPGSPSAQASCLATLQRFTRAAGFSSAVAEQASLARRPSSRAVYQAPWSFEPLSQASFRALTMKTLFLLALATAKRVGELQALSSIVTFVAGDACLSYIPQFVAKSESLTRSIPRSFLVKSLADFAAGLDTDLLLCPVRALRLYLLRVRSLSPGRHRLFVSPRRPTRPLSKNAVSFFLREVISAAGAARPQVGPLRAHEVRSVSTSVAFHRNWSVSSVLESATWASSLVFSSFYLRDIQHEFDGLLSLGPFVAAGSRIG